MAEERRVSKNGNGSLSGLAGGEALLEGRPGNVAVAPPFDAGAIFASEQERLSLLYRQLLASRNELQLQLDEINRQLQQTEGGLGQLTRLERIMAASGVREGGGNGEGGA